MRLKRVVLVLEGEEEGGEEHGLDVDGEVSGGEERQVAVSLQFPNLSHAVFSLRK